MMCGQTEQEEISVGGEEVLGFLEFEDVFSEWLQIEQS